MAGYPAIPDIRPYPTTHAHMEKRRVERQTFRMIEELLYQRYKYKFVRFKHL